MKSFLISIFLFSLAFEAHANCYNRLPYNIDDNLKDKIDKHVNYVLNKGVQGLNILIGSRDGVLYQNSFGAVQDRTNNLNTIYDIASITKLFTATALVKYLHKNNISLKTKMIDIIGGDFNDTKLKVTLEDLLRHESGYKAGLLQEEFGQNANETWENIINIHPKRRYKKFHYSDLNFLLLQKWFEIKSGKSLDTLINESIIKPLDLKKTFFNPKSIHLNSIAPTMEDSLGIVHDPTARFLGGIAGNAGLFTTINDLARYASLFLNKGMYCQSSIISSQVIEMMTEKISNSNRGLGFDILSGYSNRPRGDFSRGKSFGHTGYTGTSLWIDPIKGVVVIVLSNSVYKIESKPAFLKFNKELAISISNGL